MDAFNDIRPYHNHEARAVLDRLLLDQDLLKVIALHRFPTLTRLCPQLVIRIASLILRYKTRHIHDIQSFQATAVEPYLTHVIKDTTSDVTFSGLKHLQKNTAYLFLSNHRDIVLDPALVNYALYKNGMETCQIAIGDNLIQRPFVSDLMRLNKSFIVKRSATGRKEKLQAFQTLSAYINHCIEIGQPVWIAQSEGRAKDGNDQTDPAIIKMFNLAQRNNEHSFAENMHALNIVPVAISYELDPCDTHKAQELYEKELNGAYQKAEGEDMKSIVEGIEGFKGKVHISFGVPLTTQDFQNANDVAAAVDQHIHQHYQLSAINFLAWETIKEEMLTQQPDLASIPAINTLFNAFELAKKQHDFTQRIAQCTSAYRPWLLRMYAQPVINHYCN